MKVVEPFVPSVGCLDDLEKFNTTTRVLQVEGKFCSASLKTLEMKPDASPPRYMLDVDTCEE